MTHHDTSAGERPWTAADMHKAYCEWAEKDNEDDLPADADEVFEAAWKACEKRTAAPDLYEALNGIVRILEAVRYQVGLGKSQLERLERARAALARARGECP